MRKKTQTNWSGHPIWQVLAIFFWVLSIPAQSAYAQNSARDLAFIRIHVLDLLANEQRLPLPVQQRREALNEYYVAADNYMLFIGTERAEGLITRLANAHIDGLDPNNYPASQLADLWAALPQADQRSQAIIELHMASAFLQYVSDLKVGRVLPARVDPDFFLAERQIDQVDALNGLSQSPDTNAYIDMWQPTAPDYANLRVALSSYRQLEARGGWPRVAMGETLKPGMTDARIVALRTRIDVTYPPISPTETPDFYDAKLEQRVKKFQKQHGLDVDGAVGPATFAALNTPVSERLDSILVAMERWRWMPDNLGDQYIFVNIAGFEMRRFNRGVEEERMNVVVGKPFHRTPVFSDEIEYLEINPYWNVPKSITFNELLPDLQSNPAGLASRGFEAVRGDQVIDLRSVDWSAYGPNNFPFYIRQRPGDNNALGQVKFMFPNPHSVYLHDSPARSLYSRSVRAFSHGCVRLERPLDLIPQVLTAGGIGGWDIQRVNQTLATGERTVVSLQKTLPVHITYLTAWVDDGVPNFRGDIYGHDEKLIAALQGSARAW